MKTKSSIIFLFIFCLALASCKEKAKKKVETPTKPVEKEVKKPVEIVEAKPSLVFTVQIGAYKKENTNLASLSGVSQYNEDGLIKYRLGGFSTYEAATAYKKSILANFSDAFIQALKDSERIVITKAIALQK